MATRPPDLRKPDGLPVAKPEEPPAPVTSRVALELVLFVAIALLAAAGVKAFVAQPFYIPSPSMHPQLKVNDRVVVSKLAYKLHDPRRGDVVVFDEPPGVSVGQEEKPASSNPVARLVRGLGERIGVVPPSTSEYIKRVIALPGETIDVRDGVVYIGDKRLEEPYLPPGTITVGSSRLPYTVAPDELWVMGDNRPGSSDSRVFGPIKQNTVVGRAFVKVWPLGDASFL